MNDKLQQDVMRFRERERVKEQLDKLNMKRPWVVWREADEKREEAEKERNAAAQAVKDHEKTAKPDLDLKKYVTGSGGARRGAHRFPIRTYVP